MRIVFLYPLNKDAFDFLRDKLPKDIEIIAKIRGEDYQGIPPNQDPEIIAAVKDAEILLGPYVTEEILQQATPQFDGKLKVILIPWTGVDRLDLNLTKKFQVPVANSHGNARTIAEFGIALLLTAAKNIIHHDKLLRNGDWSSRFKDYPSINITGKTIGLLGFGAIGTECAKMLKCFDVRLIACRRSLEKTTVAQKTLVEKVYAYTEVHEFLCQADAIISSLPLTAETKGFLSDKEFAAMKDGVILINVGRGPTIDEKALYNALLNGKLFAAGLDPQWNYPPRRETKNKKGEIESEKDLKIFPSNYPLHEFDNVVLSPHRAGHVAEGYERAHWQDVIENILRIYQGLEPENLIDIEKGY